MQQLYNEWSASYDSVENKTRDLEKTAGQHLLSAVSFSRVLELGCGTGKNTEWLQAKAQHITAVDLSVGMLKKAKENISAEHIQFVSADITRPWSFVSQQFDLVTCSLILQPIFAEAHKALRANGAFYICELPPYKQYTGSKARFETEEGLQVLDCFVHHASDCVGAAMQNGFAVAAFQ